MYVSHLQLGHPAMRLSRGIPIGSADSRRGKAVVWLLLVIACGAGGFWWWKTAEGAADGNSIDEAIIHTVDRQDFSLDITERGEIQSAGGVEVKSQVKSNNSAGNAILRIVPEGPRLLRVIFWSSSTRQPSNPIA